MRGMEEAYEIYKQAQIKQREGELKRWRYELERDYSIKELREWATLWGLSVKGRSKQTYIDALVTAKAEKLNKEA